MPNVVIGIGGTGSRVLQQVVHLCDCGYFSKEDELRVLIIDPDVYNGNKNKTEELIDLYNECRNTCRPKDSKTHFFRTEIKPAAKGRYSLAPTVAKNKDGENIETLQELAEYENNPTATNFMKAAYSKKEYSEINMEQGYFAHPSVGAFALPKWIDDDEHFQGLLADMETEAGATGGNVQVFIIASAFGGTGAAGFAAVAQAFKHKLKDHSSKLSIGGAFLMPYFAFNRRGSTDGQNDTIDPKVFMEATLSAMRYYADTQTHKHFDKVYVLGAPEANEEDAEAARLTRNDYADKGSEQENWPHIIELYCALATKDFFDTSVRENKANKGAWVGVSISKPQLTSITWEDIPGGHELRKSLSKFLLFNYVYVPSLLSEFTKFKASSASKIEKLSRRDISYNIFGSNPFSFKPGLLSRWEWDERFGDTSGLVRFGKLLQYFDMHIDWLFKMLTDYDNDVVQSAMDGKPPKHLFNELFKSDMLQARWLDMHRLANGQSDFAQIKKDVSETNGGNIGERAFVDGDQKSAGVKYHEIFAHLQNHVKGVSDKGDFDAAARELITATYEALAKVVK